MTDPLPRGPFSTPRDRHLVYMQPSRNWRWLGRDDDGVGTLDVGPTQVITVERAGAVERAVVGGIEALSPHCRFLTQPLAETAVQGLANFIRKEGRRVAQDAEPRFSYEVTLTVYAEIDAWPKVPGVTSAPWRPFEPLDDLHLRDASAAAMARAEDRVIRTAWRVAWLAHPWTIERVPPLLRDHFKVVSDIDVPRGMLRLAEEV